MHITNNTNENQSNASNIRRALKQLNITIPEPKPVKKFVADNRPNLHELATQEIRANRDPLDNEDIRTELLRKLLDTTVNSYHTIELAESKAVLEHYKAHADTILDTMQEQFDAAVEVLKNKHAQIGGGALESMGVDKHHVARAEATVALEQTHTILNTWGMLVPFLTGKTGSTIHPHLRFVDVTLTEQREHNLARGRTRNGGMLNVWDALNLGLTISFTVDPAEVTRRSETLDAEAQRERANARHEMRLG